jgi:hypothetical protein
MVKCFFFSRFSVISQTVDFRQEEDNSLGRHYKNLSSKYDKFNFFSPGKIWQLKGIFFQKLVWTSHIAYTSFFLGGDGGGGGGGQVGANHR